MPHGRSLVAFGAAFFIFLLTVSAATASQPATPITKTLTVPADTTFLNTGVTLKVGQSALISATGIISYGSLNPACAGATITPNGCSAETICPIAGGCGELVGRLGNGRPFPPGALWLGINDSAGAFRDNTGAFTVKISFDAFALAGAVTTLGCGEQATTCSTPPKPVAGVTVTASGASDASTVTSSNGTYALDLPAGTYTVTAGDGKTFTPSTRTVDLDRDASGVDFTSAPTFRLLHILTLTPRSGETLDNLFVGSSVSYGLDGWDPNGGPIAVTYDNQPVASLAPPSATARQVVGTFKIPAWVTRGTVSDQQSCKGTLVAKQGALTSDLTLKSEPVGAIVYADKPAGALKTGDLYCSGEYITDRKTGIAPTDFQAPSGAIIYTLPVAASAFSVNNAVGLLFIDDPERGIWVTSVGLTPASLVCVHLTGSDWLTVDGAAGGLANSSVVSHPCAARPDPTQGHVASPLINTAPEEIQVLNSPSSADTLSGFNVADGGVRFTNPVKFENVVLYSPQDIIFAAGLSGLGDVLSNDSIEIKGRTEVNGDELLAHNELVLSGS
jgi:hypothetical protein